MRHLDASTGRTTVTPEDLDDIIAAELARGCPGGITRARNCSTSSLAVAMKAQMSEVQVGAQVFVPFPAADDIIANSVSSSRPERSSPSQLGYRLVNEIGHG